MAGARYGPRAVICRSCPGALRVAFGACSTMGRSLWFLVLALVLMGGDLRPAFYDGPLAAISRSCHVAPRVVLYGLCFIMDCLLRSLVLAMVPHERRSLAGAL